MRLVRRLVRLKEALLNRELPATSEYIYTVIIFPLWDISIYSAVREPFSSYFLTICWQYRILPFDCRDEWDYHLATLYAYKSSSSAASQDLQYNTVMCNVQYTAPLFKIIHLRT